MTAGRADLQAKPGDIQAQQEAEAFERDRPEMQAMASSVDLSGLRLVMRQHGYQLIDDLITSASITRTIEGASTLTLVIMDQDRQLQNTRFLGENIDVELDGLWFRLVHVTRNGDDLTLTFEDREVAALRVKAKNLQAWGKVTRTQFALLLIRSHKRNKKKGHWDGTYNGAGLHHLPVVIPELKLKKTISSKKNRKNNKSHEPGLPSQAVTGLPGQEQVTNLTVKGVKMSKQQLSNAERILDVGSHMLVTEVDPNAPTGMQGQVKQGVRRKLMVCAMMTVIQESRIQNVVGVTRQDGTKYNVGCFQQDSAQGWPASRDIEKDAKAFFNHAITEDRKNPTEQYWELCANVQNPKHQYRKLYGQWRLEAERIVTAYGQAGGDSTDIAALFGTNLSAWDPTLIQDASAKYQFYCGIQKKKQWKPEPVWDCLGRLMDDVNWRRFVVTGKLYLVSEEWLFKMKPSFVFTEDTDGVDYIDFDYDVGKRNSQCTVYCRCEGWQAPPGTTVLIQEAGIISGKWLVTDITRPDLFQPDVEITLKKPRAKLPEPKKDSKSKKWPNLPWPKADGKTHQHTGGNYFMPITNSPMPTSSSFLNPDGPEGVADGKGGHVHGAMDWFAPPGSRVFAPSFGHVVEVKQSRGNSGQVFGGVVKVQEMGGRVWVFRHVQPTASMFVGKPVNGGDQVASVVRWADNPSSSHCHIELWKTKGGGYVISNMIDPWKELGGG